MGEFEMKTAVAKVHEGGDLKSVLAALTEGQPYVTVKAPENPKPVRMTDKLRTALHRLPEVFGRVQPEQRRQLTSDELAEAYAEYEVLKEIDNLLETRREALKEVVRNHMDLIAEAQGLAGEGTPTDKNGHYVVASRGNPERTYIPGTDVDFSREYRSGSPNVSEELFRDLYEQGEISREDFLAFTVEKRVLDNNKIMTSVTKRPELLKVLARITVPGRPSTGLYVRKTRVN